jgi:hypothetical protein
MKVKDIRHYRTFYKNEIRDLPNRDEHFIGTHYHNESNLKKIFGWFEIYHGDKEGYGKTEEGIGNFLQSFLDMAKDGQAVYEFLQNAVDAQSTHFTMAWGKDEVDGNNYVLIANNGEMFNFDSVRSILNVGSSTKTADSQNIGKFGIGFKLAHRLVGKENGLEELLSNEPSGPILFSWKNYEILQLADEEMPEPQPIDFHSLGNDKYEINDYHPWLFKILITCFPTLPENGHNNEQIKLADGQFAKEPVFKKAEYSALSRWVKKYIDILDKQTYQEGALFFIKLGLGKENDLADHNLAEGVRFSLAILQETSEDKSTRKTVLETVQLNRNLPIKRPDLNYLYFHISKTQNLSDYLFIRFGVKDEKELTSDQKNKFKREDNIEVLFGFREFNEIGEYFKGAPNFYLYFPLSEEVHNFNFVLHSNAFYKASSRTFLHKGTVGEDGINERLLRTIANRLKLELLNLCQSVEPSDRQKFLHLYAALLTSKESSNNDRLWVKQPFIDIITQNLKSCIPVRSNFESNDFSIEQGSVKIKKTAIDLSPQAWGLQEIKWFYWGASAPVNIRYSAIEKLNLLVFDIFQLLQKEGISSFVNKWIEEDKSRIKGLFEELNQIPDPEKVKTANFRQNLSNLKLFEFDEGTPLSINEVTSMQDKGYFILHNQLASIDNELRKCGIKTSKVNLDDYTFYQNYNSYFGADSQLRSQPTLIKIFSSCLSDEVSAMLLAVEKLKIFRVFRDMIEEGKRGERLKELKIFTNRDGKTIELKHILLKTEKTWLNPFLLSEKEQHVDVDRYLLNSDEQVYENIIFKFWKEIGNTICNSPDFGLVNILEDIEAYYLKCEYSRDEEILLSDHGRIFFGNELKEVDKPFEHENLSNIPIKDYAEVQSTLKNKLGIYLPDIKYLEIYKKVPFRFKVKIDPLEFENIILTAKECFDLLLFFQTCGFEIFSGHTLYKLTNGDFTFVKDKAQNYFTSNDKIKNYITEFSNKELILLPDEFTVFYPLVSLQSEQLSSFLINNLKTESEKQLIKLTDALLGEKDELLAELLNKYEKIILDINWDPIIANESKLKLIKRLLKDDQENLKSIQEKVVLKDIEDYFSLSSIDSANDDISINFKEKEIKLSRALLLGFEDARGIRKIIDFGLQTVKRGVLSDKEAKTLFKIQETGITDELIEKFNESLKENKLTNTHQLVLVIICNKISRDAIHKYKVLDAADAWQELSGNLLLPYSENIDLYKPYFVLSSKYNGLKDVAQLNESEPYYYGFIDPDTDEENSDYLLPGFLFKIGCSAKILKEESDIIVLIEHLYHQWIQTSQEIRKDRRNQPWKDVLGFDPREKIAAGPRLEDELLPIEIQDWLDENYVVKAPFLKAIGVQTDRSDIVRLRNWFLNKSNEEVTELMIEQIPEYFLSNTLVGLAEGFLEPFKEAVIFEINSKKHLFVNRIIQRLVESEESNEIRLPVYTSKTKLYLGSENNDWPKYLTAENHDLIIQQCNETYLNNLFRSIQIIIRKDIYNQFAEEQYKELIIDFEFSLSTSPNEHEEPFYRTWRDTNSVKLVRMTAIKYKATVELNDAKIELGEIEKGDYYLDNTEEVSIIYYKEKIRWEELSDILDVDDHSELKDLLNELIGSRNRTLAAFYHTLTSSGRDDFDDEDTRRILDNLKMRNLEEERSAIIKDILAEEAYSYKWFVNYIKYLLSFENIAETISQKSISFQRIKSYSIEGKVSEKYFILEGANSLIPVNIEAFEDFSISIVFANQRRENITVEGVSKKGQDLLTYVPKGIESGIKSSFQQAVNIKINFSPVLDLVKRLYSAFTNTNIITPWINFKESAPPIRFIYGPPGTGKTTMLCTLLEETYKENPVFKALLLVPTNKAGDVLAKKMYSRNTYLSIVRIGSATDPELEAMEQEVYQSSLDDAQLDSYNLVISTIHRLPYYQINNEGGAYYNLFSCEVQWDFIIFDESSMISLPYMVFALMALKTHNPQAKIIVAGDPKQIPPVEDISDKELENLELDGENIYKMFQINSFKKAEQDLIKREIDSIENLTKQFRSVEKIGQLFSEFSYQNLLFHGRDYTIEPIKPLPESFIHSLNSSIALIDFPLDIENSVFTPKKLLYSSYHVYAGILTSELVIHLDHCNNNHRKYNIGIISPYKAQAMLMNKLIASSGISESIQVYCDTVHGFQGDECDIVIFLINPNNTYYTGHKNSLLSKEYIYNVAISRARDYLWILSPYKSIPNNPFVQKIKEILNIKDQNIISSNEIELELFKDKDFIVKNSYLTGHDNINVFGQVEMKYFIKAGDTAIDIQLRKD